jgi:hypothetical protein
MSVLAIKQYLTEVEEALISKENKSVIDGLRSTDIILSHLDKKKAIRILNLLGQLIKWIVPTELNGAIRTARKIIKEKPVFYKKEFEILILDGLKMLASDTDLNTKGLNVPFLEKLKIRQSAVRLSYTLYEYYNKHNKPIPNAIITWKNICSSIEEFAEIRNEWLTDIE